MSAKKANLKELELIKGLKSSDSKVVLRSIKSAKIHGSIPVFEAILELFKTSQDDQKLHQEIVNFIYDLKSSDAMDVLIKAIGDQSQIKNKASLISAFWNSPLNPNEHIALFVKEAIAGDFLVALECSTVLSEIEGPFPEIQVNESLIMLKDYFSQSPSGEKTEIIKDVLRVIQEMENSVNLN